MTHAAQINSVHPSSKATIVKALEKVGERLQAERGEGLLTRKELVEAVVKACDCAPSSVIPSDHCFNRTNNGLRAHHVPFFLHEGRGSYRFVGRHYTFTGVTMHRPRLPRG